MQNPNPCTGGTRERDVATKSIINERLIRLDLLIDWLINCLIDRLINWVNSALKIISAISQRSVSLAMLSSIYLARIPKNILSEPLVSILLEHRQNNGVRWGRNESCRARAIIYPRNAIVKSGNRTSDLLVQLIYGVSTDSQFKPLPHHPDFKRPRKRSIWKHYGKRRKCW